MTQESAPTEAMRSETELPQSRRTRRIWGIVFVVQSVLLALALVALARGTPDAYLTSMLGRQLLPPSALAFRSSS